MNESLIDFYIIYLVTIPFGNEIKHLLGMKICISWKFDL